MRVLGIVPARAGSKGIVGKNIKPLNGKPLLHWVARALLDSSGLSRVVCSTDSEEIASHAKKAGLEVPFLRPAELASDESLVVDAVLDALARLDESEDPYTHVFLAQPTSPTLLPRDISAALKLIGKQGFDSVISVTPIPHMFSPVTAFTANKNGELEPFSNSGELVARRQDLSTYYARAGLLYATSVEQIRQAKSFYGGKLGFVEIDSWRAVSIDNETDFSRAEAIVAAMQSSPVGGES